MASASSPSWEPLSHASDVCFFPKRSARSDETHVTGFILGRRLRGDKNASYRPQSLPVGSYHPLCLVTLFILGLGSLCTLNKGYGVSIQSAGGVFCFRIDLLQSLKNWPKVGPIYIHLTVEARTLECDRPLIPKQMKE